MSERRQDEEEWQDPHYRKGRRRMQKDTSVSKVITKFFVSNLHPKCSSADLKDIFRRFGTYENSYIARKFDRLGKRFGFVSFSGVKDAATMLGEMKDLWMGSYKLFVSMARFVDGVRVDDPMDVTKRKGKEKEQEQQANYNVGVDCSHANPNVGDANQGSSAAAVGVGGVNTGSSRSFLDSLLNRNKVDVITVDDNVEGFVQWYKVAVIGKVIDFKTLNNLRSCLSVRGWKEVDIKYVGGLTVLLVFKSEEVCNKFWMDKELVANMFVSLDKWDGNHGMPDERLVWLQVYAVPVQLAIDQVFDMVGSRYGEIVKPAKVSLEEKNFSVVYIGVLSKTRAKIVDQVDVRWRGKSYRLWIEEDVSEWVPDCVEDEDDTTVDMVEDHVDTRSQLDRNEEDHGVEVEVGEIMEGRREEDNNVFNIGAGSFEEDKVASVRKKFKRRSARKSKGEESNSQERPKKRHREDNDIFGLDKLIGIVGTSSASEDSVEGEGLCTPDLNRPTVEEDNLGEGNGDGIEVQGRISLEEETRKTVHAGEVLGASNIGEFVQELNVMISEEGFQSVAQ